MNLLRLSVFGLALGGGLITTNTAAAAWNNVFQVCCNDCGPPRVSYSPPSPQACPQPEMRVSYVQRSYYQPVTEYVQKSYYEPVRQNVTSYYYEPVTEYRYSTYYDPCTGCPQRVSTPTTSYRLRSQCNSVTSYVMRTSIVPVTSLKPVTVQQPVVSYYYPPQIVGSATPSFAPPMPVETPKVEEYRNPPSVMPSNSSDTIPPQTIPTSPGSFQRPGPNTALRPDKTTSRNSIVTFRGEVVLRDEITPRGNVKLVFVNADKPEQKEYVTSNAYGEFDVRLGAGKWYLYLGGENGRATYYKQMNLGDRETYDFKVVSR
jgi:hypothetical protein